jgi:hypothetical protein
VNDGYPDNADLLIAEGRPVFKRRRGKQRRASAVALEKTLLSRLPERGLLDVLTRTAKALFVSPKPTKEVTINPGVIFGRFPSASARRAGRSGSRGSAARPLPH